MRNILLYLLMGVLIVSCLQNELDLDYQTQTEKKENPTNPVFEIKGERKGTLKCPACCDDEYDFDLDIKEYNPTSHEVKGTLKISTLKEKSYGKGHARFKVKGTYENEVLTLKTKKAYDIVQTSCDFCTNNTYVLRKQKDGSFKGDWKESSCDKTVIQSAKIYLKTKIK